MTPPVTTLELRNRESPSQRIARRMTRMMTLTSLLQIGNDNYMLAHCPMPASFLVWVHWVLTPTWPTVWVFWLGSMFWYHFSESSTCSAGQHSSCNTGPIVLSKNVYKTFSHNWTDNTVYNWRISRFSISMAPPEKRPKMRREARKRAAENTAAKATTDEKKTKKDQVGST